MRPVFQMKDKNKNIVYDSKDYVYRSEEKEPDKLTTDEIAFEITTRNFKEMGFEGIINWVQNIAKEEDVFDQMITALKKEKKNEKEKIKNIIKTISK